MNITINTKSRVCLFLLMFILLETEIQAQVPNMTLTIQNELQTSDKTLEFDVYLLNTNPSVSFEMNTMQLAITMNSSIINGGTITPSFVSGGSDLIAVQVPDNTRFDDTGTLPMIKISAKTPPGYGNGTFISTTAPGTRFCRLRLTNSVAFASAAANLDFQLVKTPPFYTGVAYYDHTLLKGDIIPLNTSNTYSSTANPVLNSLATVSTDAVSATNVASGTLSGLGSPYATDYGFVYSSTNNAPAITDSKVSKGASSATGSYSAELTSLTPGTTYYVRAYATNSVETSYGSVVSFVAANLAPTGLSYTTPNVYTKGTAITSLSPSVTGSVVSYGITPALPAGLSFDTSTGIVSGTPTALLTVTDYTVTATNTYGNTSATVRITVNDVAPSGLSYTTPNVYTKGTAMTALNPTVSGGIVTSYTISPALPDGLSINATTGVISGTPTVVSAAATYTVTAANTGGSTTATLTITVNDIAPTGLNYTTPNLFTKGLVITSLTPTVSGGAVISYTISPALPTGLSIDATTGIISGTPTILRAAVNYTVRATNTGGSITKVVSITVNDAAPSGLSYTTPNVYTKGTAITSLTPTVSGGSVTSYSISPSLPAGLSFNTSTGVISGTPTVISASANYTVTATNSGGNTTNVINITINDIAPSGLNYTTPNVYTKGTAITSFSPTVGGGAVTSYTISPALPAGLSINATTGVISGTPTVITTATTYTVTATNTGGSTTATIGITVNDIAPSGLSYNTPNVFITETAIASLSPTVSGGTVISYTISPALPSGLSLDAVSGIISGTPTVATAAANYVVTASNSGGSTTATVNIAVKNATKQLSVKAYLQSLWNSSTLKMNQCLTANGVTPQFTTAVDAVSVELHDPSDYLTIVYTASNLLLEPDGTIHAAGLGFIEIPGIYSKSYYITIKTRNHLETTSGTAVSFASDNISYDFTSAASQAYGSNQGKLKNGIYGIYAGDLNLDGWIDYLDYVQMDIKIQMFSLGYQLEDLNGDGFVDYSDYVILDNNVNGFYYVLHP